jgi:tellurite resistance protein
MTFAHALELLASASLVLAIVQAYLVVNKVWRRKHEVAVCEAQSLVSNVLGLATSLPWIVKYVRDGELKNAAIGLVWLVLTVFFTALALRVWVPSSRREPFLSRVFRALRSERAEAGELVAAIFRPAGRDLLVDILREIALADGTLDDRERDFVAKFAATWGVPFALARGQGKHDPVRLQHAITRYVALRPPREQVAQLREIVAQLSKIDGGVSEAEDLVVREVCATLDAYLDASGARAPYLVHVVPQGDAQATALRSLLPNVELAPYRGGRAALVGSFHSEGYACLVRDRYRALRFFSIVEHDGARE